MSTYYDLIENSISKVSTHSNEDLDIALFNLYVERTVLDAMEPTKLNLNGLFDKLDKYEQALNNEIANRILLGDYEDTK